MNSFKAVTRSAPAPNRLRSVEMAAHRRAAHAGLFCMLLLVPSIQALAEDGSDQAPRVSVIAASTAAIRQSVSVVGTVVSRETTLVNAELEGVRIASVNAEEGDLVAAGQGLATLESSKIEIELLQNDAQRDSSKAQRGQALSALQNASISREEAEADLRRAERLVPKGLLSQEVLEQRQKALSRAEIAVQSGGEMLKAAQAAFDMVLATRRDIELRLSHTQILAPASGRIIKRTARVGGVASMSGDQLFIIANDDQFELEVEVPQSQFGAIAVGSIAEVLLSDGDVPVRSSVRFVAPALAEDTRLGRARIALPHGLLAPIGAFASARIEIGQSSGIFLPASAIINTDDQPSTTILRNKRIERKPVTIGMRQDGLVEVRSGIDEGDLVVLKSGSFMDEGDEAAPVLVQADVSTDRKSGRGVAP